MILSNDIALARLLDPRHPVRFLQGMANEAGYCAALDNLPREVPMQHQEFFDQWLAGWDEGKGVLK